MGGAVAAKAANHRTGHIRVLQESAALFNFLNANGIRSMQQFHEKISEMNTCYHDLRGKIVKTERRSATLAESSEMWKQYSQYKAVRVHDIHRQAVSGPCRHHQEMNT